MLLRFCLYGFLKNQRYFEPFFMLALLSHELNFFWIGCLYASRSLTLNLLEIPSGAIADSWGRRGCMIFSFVAYIISFLVFALATDPIWFFPAMVLFGVGDCFRTGTHKAMIFEWLRLQGRESERTQIYGLTRSWSKYGSATSAMAAAIFVIWTGDYRSVFLFAIVPYGINIINFLGYPKELDGVAASASHTDDPKGNPPSAKRSTNLIWETLRTTLKTVGKSANLKRLIAESMTWDGILIAIKDYLQPVLATVVLATLATSAMSTDQWTALVIGVIYTVLFLLSGFASRTAHQVVTAAGGHAAAAHRLWLFNLALYATLVVADLANWMPLTAALFVALIVLHNIWRPILISRFDDFSEPEQGATMLSVESQAQRLTTLVVAPCIGLSVDWVIGDQILGAYWPIGVVGGLAASVMYLTGRSGGPPQAAIKAGNPTD